MAALGRVLAKLAAACAEEKLDWYLFGAQALAVHGRPRATQDVDVTVLASASQARVLLARLGRVGLVERFPDDREELLTASVVPLVDRQEGCDVDVVLGCLPTEVLAASRAGHVFVDGALVPVISATDLAVAKVLAGRALDLEDVRSLLLGGAVDREDVRAQLRAMERALGESGLVQAFDALG